MENNDSMREFFSQPHSAHTHTRNRCRVTANAINGARPYQTKRINWRNDHIQSVDNSNSCRCVTCRHMPKMKSHTTILRQQENP